ncbi:unnamed protein product [Polarella glacialis]|uniref:Kinesin-like protein n=1 Tax=Polarella glacialis TaxID=89957 RepID=A0A813FNU4_POLGL|nr:unnamed protein product [Polarella glacialis]CAE8657992.1 unnamed protein product [Polarella glacialis]
MSSPSAPPCLPPGPPRLQRLRSSSESDLADAQTCTRDNSNSNDNKREVQGGSHSAHPHGATASDFRPLSARETRGRPPGSEPRASGFETLEWEEAGQARAGNGDKERIRVAARFRPLSESERLAGGEENIAVRFGADGQSCTLRTGNLHGVNEFPFAYDYMFQPESAQEDVYNVVARPIVEGVINGFNGAIIAYGQTGSGKTHTMLGPAGAKSFVDDGDEVDFQSLGIIPRALQDLLDYAATAEGLVQLRASYVETYNEHVIDLLSPVKGGSMVRDQVPKSAAIREQAEVLYLPTVTETPIGSVRQALEVMRTGNKNRHQAETKMNRHSSRSHAVFIVTVTNKVDQTRQKFAQLYLVDLAGSERVLKTGVEGMQLEEAKNINRSLLALGQVIWALAHKQKHVPYRDSKLTQLLRNCLGGNARTAVMIAASPHIQNASESLSALRFGARASLVESAAKQNVAEDAKELKRLLEGARRDLNELRGHCRQLQAELAAFNAVESTPSVGPCPPVAEGALQGMTSKRLLVWGLLPSLVCPINRAVMREPVVASDGWTYERRAIEKHFTRSGRSMPRATMPMSPVTGHRLCTKHLVPNLVVQQLVRLHMPQLAPLEQQLPMIQLLHVWHVQLILSFLDSSSLGRCERAWSSFFAAAESSQAWAQRIAWEFPLQADDKAATCSTRALYSQLRSAAMKARADADTEGAELGPSKGLTLFKPPNS